MAIVDFINLGADLQVVVADADPRTSGVDVPKGSLILLNDGTASFFKSGTLSTDWSLSLLGSGTADKVPKFIGTGASGVIGNSAITDNGSIIQLGLLTYASSDIYNSSFYASSSGIDLSTITWAGASSTTNALPVPN